MADSTNKPINQTDLARLAGVTRLTVQRALDGQPGVGSDTAQRIRQLAQKHGYRPNVAARATRSGRLGSIDLLVSNLRGGVSRMPYGLLDGVHDAISRHGLRLTLSQVSDDKLSDPQYMPNILREFMADGVLINYAFDFPASMSELIARHQIPAIWLNSNHPHDAVYPDEREAGRIAAQHLIDHGHRRIGFVRLNQGSHFSSKHRVAGYTEALTQAGLEPQVVELGARPFHLIEEDGFDRDERSPLMDQYLAGLDGVTAVVAYSSSCASVLMRCAAARGIDIPSQLSVVTIADQVMAASGLALDTVTLGWQGIGSVAVEMLQAKINSPKQTLPSRVTPVALRRGVSVAQLND